MVDLIFMFDSDALIQVLHAGPTNLFSLLRSNFGVRSYLMNEVEVEVRANKKFGGLVRPKLEKALKAKTLQLLTSSVLDDLAVPGERPVSLEAIRDLGTEYAFDVGKGEAYTHAAAILLNMPAVSNDFNAIRVLQAKGKRLPPTVLRSYDIFGFLLQESFITAAQAESTLQDLKRFSEWVPKQMQHASFVDGLPLISCRLSTSLSLSADPESWSSTLYLPRKHQ